MVCGGADANIIWGYWGEGHVKHIKHVKHINHINHINHISHNDIMTIVFGLQALVGSASAESLE